MIIWMYGHVIQITLIVYIIMYDMYVMLKRTSNFEDNKSKHAAWPDTQMFFFGGSRKDGKEFH